MLVSAIKDQEREKKRACSWPLVIGTPILLVLFALTIGAVLKIADPTYRSDSTPRISTPLTPESAPEQQSDSNMPDHDSDIGTRTSDDTQGTGSVPDAMLHPSQTEQVIKTGEIALAVAEDQVDSTYLNASTIARELGGFVSSSSTTNDRTGKGASVVVKVPAQRFEELIDKISKLGEIRSMTTSGQDVSGQFVDLKARLRNLEAQRDQLLTLMSQARTVQETIVVQDRLFAVTEQIEQIRGQIQALESKITYSSLTIKIFLASTPGTAEGWGTGKALSRAAHAFVDTFNGFVVLMGPVTFLGIIAALIWLPIRYVVRRRNASRKVMNEEPRAA